MTEPENRAGALLAALRADLPSERDDARVRRKLAGAGVAVGATTATSTWAHAAATAGAKAATTSSAPSAVALSGATASKATLVTATWASLSTGTKLAVVSIAVASGAYPAMSHWATPATPATPVHTAPVYTAPSPLEPRRPPNHNNLTQTNPQGGEAGGTAAASSPAANTRAPSVAPTTRPALASRTAARQTATTTTAREPLAHSMGHSEAGADARIDLHLREETALIERALIAVRANDTIAAARWLDQHERRFSSGVLARERERLRAALR